MTTAMADLCVPAAVGFKTAASTAAERDVNLIGFPPAHHGAETS
ncbi:MULTISPECIES: hypothetical protein [Actinomycetes]|uniref:Uncharacterized protein n=1 Tax=Streptomyces tendae TaxID=1932 RepID=A0ABW7S9M8_STRTE|nr:MULTISPECIES: hypothetical protein [Streptomyces]